MVQCVRRSLLAVTLALQAAVVVAGGQNSSKPNLLFIMTDQQRFDAEVLEVPLPPTSASLPPKTTSTLPPKEVLEVVPLRTSSHFRVTRLWNIP
jgi:hypothetical protein